MKRNAAKSADLFVKQMDAYHRSDRRLTVSIYPHQSEKFRFSERAESWKLKLRSTYFRTNGRLASITKMEMLKEYQMNSLV